MTTPEFFQVLGVPALFGRTLTEDDAKATIQKRLRPC